MKLTMQDNNEELALNDQIFDYKYNEGLIHQLVNTYMGNARSGNSAQKTRSEVRGGGKKPWRQKGTGRARAGTTRSPIWRSGGVTFASKPRSYERKINKKMYRGAMRSIISELRRLERLVIVSQFQCESHRTKDFIQKMENLNLPNALIVTEELGEKEYLGCRNLHNYDICDVSSIDPISLIHYQKVVFTEGAIKCLEEQLQ